MSFKLLLLTAFVAYVQAGGPAAYSIAALSGDHAYVGSSQEHTVKGLYGQNVVSSYAKAVDSAHSSVRVSSSRQSNDILGGGYHSGYASPAVVGGYSGYGGGYGVSKVVAAPAYGAYGAAPAYGAYGAAPAYGAYGAGYGKVVSPVSAVVSHGYAAPAIATHSYASPAYGGYGGYGVSKAVVAPAAVYGGYGHNLGYASKVVAPVSTVVSHGIAAPALGYGASAYGGYGASAYGGYGGLGYGVSKVASPLSTVVSHGYAAAPAYGGYGYAPKVVAPALSHAIAAPALGYSKVVTAAAPAYGAYGGYGAYGNGLGYGVSKVVSPYHSVAAAPAYGGYGGYGGYGVSKVVSPIATLGVGHVGAVKAVGNPAFTASVISPGASYSW